MHAFDIQRRQLLSGLIAAAFARNGTAAKIAVTNQTAPHIDKPLSRIDVHAHYLPDTYRRAAEAAGQGKPDGMPASLPTWSIDSALASMERLHIGTAILSISSPGVHFGNDAAARSLARTVNEEGAKAVELYPQRFGLFASLPLPDVDGALREVDYALDVLKADGIALKSNHQGIYLGDSRFDPVFAELHRRHAVVFMHPTSPYCPACQPGLTYPAPLIEFMFETTRAITHLIFTRTLSRYPNVQWIVPHAGGAAPTLSDRIAGMAPTITGGTTPTPEQVLAELRRFHYDLAGHAIPKMIDSLLEVTDIRHLLYGSDWPFTPEANVSKLAQKIDESARFDADTRKRILRDNALELLPRLRMTK